MPLPATKEALLEDLAQAFSKLDAELDAVQPEAERLRDLEGGVSCCDVMAYQIGWGRLLLEWERVEAAGGEPEMPAAGYKWNQLGALAESFYQAYEESPLSEVRAVFREVFSHLEEWICALPEDELFDLGARRWAGDKWPLVKWIQVNTIAPYQSARAKIRRWKRSAGIA